jgi:hypothetical protein
VNNGRGKTEESTKRTEREKRKVIERNKERSAPHTDLLQKLCGIVRRDRAQNDSTDRKLICLRFHRDYGKAKLV